ncbi:hypothetical protein [Paraburkholderia caribensis]|jgi:hypothetical protein|uniref:hypothetical protein n=1 Tax=Paraburkholderia caribensis TaxID=75105 RepID=UPI001D070BA4|nr:hypothetical protein [Paraburkholderia caribensis]
MLQEREATFSSKDLQGIANYFQARQVFICVATLRNFFEKLPRNVTKTPKRTKKKQGSHPAAVSFTQHDLKSRIGRRRRFGIFLATGRKVSLGKALREAFWTPRRGGQNAA